MFEVSVPLGMEARVYTETYYENSYLATMTFFSGYCVYNFIDRIF